jgi:Arc/MetJ-type ribon-helix-helix transcriptional regulator
MNQTVQLTNAKLPASFMVDEKVVGQLLEKAQQAITSGKVKSASEYVNRLVTWALENYKE